MPCRAHPANIMRAITLAGIVEQLAEEWQLAERSFRRWLQTECGLTLNSLVDRIVTGTPREHPLLASDPIADAACRPHAHCGPFQKKDRAWQFLHNPHVVWTPDVMPYFLRKVRILNGAHTASARQSLALPVFAPCASRSTRSGSWGSAGSSGCYSRKSCACASRVVLTDRRSSPGKTLDRFRNPFIEHKLAEHCRPPREQAPGPPGAHA